MKSQELTSTGLVLFGHIVRSGSLTAAAQQLGVGRAAVSKQLAALENRVGVRLLQRTTRSLSLTEAGEKVYREAQKIEEVLLSVNDIANDVQNKLRGSITVSCSNAIGRLHLIPLIHQFINKYPDISIRCQLEDRFVDLITEKVDLSIRIGHLQDSSLIARKLGELEWQVCASPSYLAKHGAPATPKDLLSHQCLYYRNSNSNMNAWGFVGPSGDEVVTVSGPLAINDANALVEAAIQGMGILYIDKVLLKRAMANGSLVEVLSNYPPMPGLPVYLLYPAKEQLPAKLAVFIEFLLESMAPLISD